MLLKPQNPDFHNAQRISIEVNKFRIKHGGVFIISQLLLHDVIDDCECVLLGLCNERSIETNVIFDNASIKDQYSKAITAKDATVSSRWSKPMSGKLEPKCGNKLETWGHGIGAGKKDGHNQ